MLNPYFGEPRMATAQSLTFQTDKDTLFAVAIHTVRDAGYTISETDDAARKIVYYADQPGNFMVAGNRFEVTITVSGASQVAAQTALLSIKAVGITVTNNGIAIQDDKFENELLNFVTNELKRQYPIVASQTTIANAPGAGVNRGGCLVLMGTLGLLATGCGLGGYMLLATLFQ